MDSCADSSSSSRSSSNNNNDTKILKVLTESILSVCNSDRTPDEKVQVVRNITESSLFVASNNNTAVVTKETHDDTQSGSDLAPFFGASVRDRIIDGMKDIINVYKSREDKRLRVEITGPNGTPVYSEASFNNVVRHCDDEDWGDDDTGLKFDTDSGDGFPLSSLNNEIEIRFGGDVVQRFNIDDLTIHFQYYPCDDDNDRLEYITLKHIHPRPNGNGSGGPITCVRGIYGPLPLGWRQNVAVGDNPFLADTGWGQELVVEIAGRELAGRTMLLTDFFKLVADENNGLTPQTLMTIHELVFDEQDITGVMSLINE